MAQQGLVSQRPEAVDCTEREHRTDQALIVILGQRNTPTGVLCSIFFSNSTRIILWNVLIALKEIVRLAFDP